MEKGGSGLILYNVSYSSLAVPRLMGIRPTVVRRVRLERIQARRGGQKAQPGQGLLFADTREEVGGLSSL